MLARGGQFRRRLHVEVSCAGALSCALPVLVLQVLSANSSSSTIRTRAETAPRTFDLSYNNFGGQLPQWLVSAVAGSIEDVTLILTVSA